MKIPMKKERIFRLLSSQDGLTLSQISQNVQLAKSYVSKVIGELKKNGVAWGTEKIYVDREKLIREWGSLKRMIFQYIRPLMIDILIPDRIRSVVKNYAISGPFAEMLVQGESSGRPLIIYLTEKEMETRKSQIVKLGNVGKGQVWFYVYDEDILSSIWEIKNWKVVCIPQICADLIALGTYADLGIKLFKRWLDVGKRV